MTYSTSDIKSVSMIRFLDSVPFMACAIDA
jgi:hypothetical protein